MTEVEVSINNSEKKKKILKKTLNFSKKVFNIFKKINFNASNKSHNTQNNRNHEVNTQDKAVEDNNDQTTTLNDDLFIEAAIENNTFRIIFNLENAANYLFDGVDNSRILIQYVKYIEDEENQRRVNSKSSKPRLQVSLLN
jgi:hypothetical protein